MTDVTPELKAIEADVASVVSIPLARAILCCEMKCSAIYRVERLTCPACGGAQGIALANAFNRDGSWRERAQKLLEEAW